MQICRAATHAAVCHVDMAHWSFVITAKVYQVLHHCIGYALQKQKQHGPMLTSHHGQHTYAAVSACLVGMRGCQVIMALACHPRKRLHNESSASPTHAMQQRSRG